MIFVAKGHIVLSHVKVNFRLYKLDLFPKIVANVDGILNLGHD